MKFEKGFNTFECFFGVSQWIVDSTYCLKGVAPFVLHDCLMRRMGEHLQKQ